MSNVDAADAVAGGSQADLRSGAGSDNSVLAELRARLVRSDLARLAFDRLLERCRELGLVNAGGKQRTDSTHVIAAVRDLNSMELAGEAVRALVEVLATVAPAFLAETVDLEAWAKRYGPPVSAWRQPRTAVEHDRLRHRGAPPTGSSAA